MPHAVSMTLAASRIDEALRQNSCCIYESDDSDFIESSICRRRIILLINRLHHYRSDSFKSLRYIYTNGEWVPERDWVMITFGTTY